VKEQSRLAGFKLNSFCVDQASMTRADWYPNCGSLVPRNSVRANP
jgi:hypothetical protein